MVAAVAGTDARPLDRVGAGRRNAGAGANGGRAPRGRDRGRDPAGGAGPVTLLRAGRNAPRLRAWCLGLALAASGAGLYLLPSALHALAWWPFLTAAAVALGWYVVALSRAAPRRRSDKSTMHGPGRVGSGVVTATVGLFAACAWLSSSDRTVSREQDLAAPPTVYLVPGATPATSLALLPRELQDRLVAAARPPDLPAAVLLSAVYEGKVVDGAALFKATFEAHSALDGAATVLLPLDGVDLVGDAEVDGKPAKDLAVAPNKGGFVVKVVDRGPHRVELSFRVPVVVGASGERGTRFTVPRLNQCRLNFQTPPGATRPFTLFRLGSRSEKDGFLRAELGRVGTVHVLWHDGNRVVADADVHFHEAYLWNLRRRQFAHRGPPLRHRRRRRARADHRLAAGIGGARGGGARPERRGGGNAPVPAAPSPAQLARERERQPALAAARLSEPRGRLL